MNDTLSYNPDHFEPLFQSEDRHFWFRTRNTVIARLARQLTQDLPPGYRVLEVGCGTGNVLRHLTRSCAGGWVVGMDLFAAGLRYARRRTRAPLLQADMNAPPFRVQFELIGLFDVLEHLPDDVTVLQRLHGMLRPNGVLLLTVPACMSLWSYFDEASHHVRRYALAELEGKLIPGGFRIEYLSHYMMSLFPLMWLQRRVVAGLRRRIAAGPDSDSAVVAREVQLVPVMNELLAFVLAQEARLIARRRHLPVGTSLLAIARKA